MCSLAMSPSASKRPHTADIMEEESTSGTPSEDIDDHESVASRGSSNHSLRSDHGAIKGNGATGAVERDEAMEQDKALEVDVVAEQQVVVGQIL